MMAAQALPACTSTTTCVSPGVGPRGRTRAMLHVRPRERHRRTQHSQHHKQSFFLSPVACFFTLRPGNGELIRMIGPLPDSDRRHVHCRSPSSAADVQMRNPDKQLKRQPTLAAPGLHWWQWRAPDQAAACSRATQRQGQNSVDNSSRRGHQPAPSRLSFEPASSQKRCGSNYAGAVRLSDEDC